MFRSVLAVWLLAFVVTSSSPAQLYELMTGVDTGRYPGAIGVTGTDGDRLAGTADVGALITFQGTGTPLLAPNHVGALSFLFRRGSLEPIPGFVLPLLAIDFLGGPLLDLDGETANGARSLIPVAGKTPVLIGAESHLAIEVDESGGDIELCRVDATGTNEGVSGLPAGWGTTVHALAGTTTSAAPGAPINPLTDTRAGTFTSFSGTGGLLTTVWRIENLGYEIWQDSIEPGALGAGSLGDYQYLGAMRGWLVKRESGSGLFPTLAGEGLGSTLWPSAAGGAVGMSVTVPDTTSVTIAAGIDSEDFTLAGNGGVALIDFGGDLGAWFDGVVVPNVPASSDSFLYLEAAGFGVSNSEIIGFADTVGYDLVLVAAEAELVDCNENGIHDVCDIAQGTSADVDGNGIPDECQGSWTDLGSALGGTHGDPLLEGTGTLIGNDPLTIALTNALESTTAYLILGLTQLNAPFKGGTLVPALDVAAFPLALPTGPLGEIPINATWPAGIPGGFTTYYQYWILDPAGPVGFSASNAISGTTP